MMSRIAQAEANEAKRQLEEAADDDWEEIEPETSLTAPQVAPAFISARKRKPAVIAPAVIKRKLKPSEDPAFEFEFDGGAKDDKPEGAIKIGNKSEGMCKHLLYIFN